MTNYVKSTDFAVKDSLISGNPAKIVKGVEINTEFAAIQTADATSIKGNGSSVDNSVARFDGTGGYQLQSSAMTVDDLGNITLNSASASGNLAFTGTANRITGDFSNATAANRVLLQTSTVNGNTSITAIPNGTAIFAGYSVLNSATDTVNVSQFGYQINAVEAQLSSTRLGTGTYLPMTFYTGGSERMRIGTDGVISGATFNAINGGQLAGLRNRIINGNFGVNQRAYVSGAAVGAGLYGHDRWKMAASGDTYTFSTTANVTTITIPAGKVLQQVIEGLNLETGTYTLSWVGTAQGKIGAGSYGASGITGSITGGTNTTIEFGPGTVSKVQLEFGSTVSVFEQRPYGLELDLCRYYARYLNNRSWVGQSSSSSTIQITGVISPSMRSAPTATLNDTAPQIRIGGGGFTASGAAITGQSNAANGYDIGISGFPAMSVGIIVTGNKSSDSILLSSEL